MRTISTYRLGTLIAHNMKFPATNISQQSVHIPHLPLTKPHLRACIASSLLNVVVPWGTPHLLISAWKHTQFPNHCVHSRTPDDGHVQKSSNSNVIHHQNPSEFTHIYCFHLYFTWNNKLAIFGEVQIIRAPIINDKFAKVLLKRHSCSK